ncbi:MAG TPA: DUF1579 family protein [Methanomicrobiales archaeon]|nr:DUF1579 family protein [Methanomicrobiales archaeon]
MTDSTTETGAGQSAGWTPRVLEPSPETRALARFHGDATWTGTVKAGGMGAGSPEMEAKGRSTCEWIISGLWLSCLFTQDQFVEGKKVLTWQAHWVAGWDPLAREYRAVGVDSNGASFMFHGRIEGDTLVMESMGDSPVKLRFTWNAGDPNAVLWKNEMSMNGGPYQLIEEYVITPSKEETRESTDRAAAR